MLWGFQEDCSFASLQCSAAVKKPRMKEQVERGPVICHFRLSYLGPRSSGLPFLVKPPAYNRRRVQLRLEELRGQPPKSRNMINCCLNMLSFIFCFVLFWQQYIADAKGYLKFLSYSPLASLQLSPPLYIINTQVIFSGISTCFYKFNLILYLLN